MEVFSKIWFTLVLIALPFLFPALALWFENKDDKLVVLAAFLFGLAAGTKYQALLFAPIFGFWIIFHTRRPLHTLMCLLLSRSAGLSGTYEIYLYRATRFILLVRGFSAIGSGIRQTSLLC